MPIMRWNNNSSRHSFASIITSNDNDKIVCALFCEQHLNYEWNQYITIFKKWSDFFWRFCIFFHSFFRSFSSLFLSFNQLFNYFWRKIERRAYWLKRLESLSLWADFTKFRTICSFSYQIATKILRKCSEMSSNLKLNPENKQQNTFLLMVSMYTKLYCITKGVMFFGRKTCYMCHWILPRCENEMNRTFPGTIALNQQHELMQKTRREKNNSIRMFKLWAK